VRRLPGQGGKTGVVPRGASRWRFGILGRPKSCAMLLSWSQEIGSQCMGTQMAVPKSRGAIDRVLASLSARAQMRWVRGVQRNRQLKMFKARADQCQCPTIPLHLHQTTVFRRTSTWGAPQIDPTWGPIPRAC